jgi:hypothetical protein
MIIRDNNLFCRILLFKIIKNKCYSTKSLHYLLLGKIDLGLASC